MSCFRLISLWCSPEKYQIPGVSRGQAKVLALISEREFSSSSSQEVLYKIK